MTLWFFSRCTEVPPTLGPDRIIRSAAGTMTTHAAESRINARQSVRIDFQVDPVVFIPVFQRPPALLDSPRRRNRFMPSPDQP